MRYNKGETVSSVVESRVMSIAAGSGESAVLSAPLSALTVVPPLENGDQLTRREFMRRWDAMPGLKKAELIEGTVYMAAAVRMSHHGRPHRMLIGWMDRFIGNTPGLDGGSDASVVLDDENMPQPDVVLFLPAGGGGKSHINADGYLEGSPELVAEVAASSVSIDLNRKFQAYRRNGVQEYLVWRVRDKAIDWFVLQDGDYQLLTPDAEGILKSRVCPGLWLDPTALIKRRTKRVNEVLDQGMASPEYREFAKRLAPFAQPEET